MQDPHAARHQDRRPHVHQGEPPDQEQARRQARALRCLPLYLLGLRLRRAALLHDEGDVEQVRTDQHRALRARDEEIGDGQGARDDGRAGKQDHEGRRRRDGSRREQQGRAEPHRGQEHDRPEGLARGDRRLPPTGRDQRGAQ
jgi:hypothetical protein